VCDSSCLYPDNAPRTGYNKGCRCTRCKTEYLTQRRAEYYRNIAVYTAYSKQYRKNKPRKRTPAPPRAVYPPRPECEYPQLSPYTAWGRGCRCTACVAVRQAHHKKMRNSLLIRAKDTMRNRARDAGVALPSDPQDRHALLCVYIKRSILAQDGIRCHVDHIVPLEHGGSHTAGNVRILTETENLRRRGNPEMECHPLDLTTPEQHIRYTEAVKKIRLKPGTSKL